MFKGMPGNMQKMLKQAQKMQEKMKEVQEGLGSKTVEASSGGGMVKVTLNGKQELLSISIENELLNPNEREMLQDLIVAAVNEGNRSAQEMAQQEMAAVTGGMGLNIPGLGNLF